MRRDDDAGRARTLRAPADGAKISRVGDLVERRDQRPLVRRASDATISIPLAGNVESLNVSVAAALFLYEARRQRRG